jgi:uncharacterized hydrophobic protein (TIGR00271 family)
VLASIGLDVSSAAVVIGAMLISPLMGPIIGVGLGMGVTNRALLQRSLQELGLAVLVSLLVSSAYFLVSPFAAPTAELLARTRPTLLDVGVAFFGGVAGIVAGSRKQLSLALPGVAIATALMPPLCTASFGLATQNWSFFFGALYLFGLNAIFIALSTFVIVRFLRFPRHEEATLVARRRERRMVAAVAVVTILPSVYFLYDSARAVRENQRIKSFVDQEINIPGRAAQQWERLRTNGTTTIKVYVAGHPIDPAAGDSLNAALARYGLEGNRLEFVQSDVSARDLERFQSDMQRDLLRVVSLASASRDSVALLRARRDSVQLAVAARELVMAFPEIEAISYAPRLNLLAPDSVSSPPGFLVSFARGTATVARRRIAERATALVRSRLDNSQIVVVER